MIELRHNELLLRGYPAASLEWMATASESERGNVADEINRKADLFETIRQSAKLVGEQKGHHEALSAVRAAIKGSELKAAEKRKFLKLIRELK